MTNFYINFSEDGRGNGSYSWHVDEVRANFSDGMHSSGTTQLYSGIESLRNIAITYAKPYIRPYDIVYVNGVVDMSVNGNFSGAVGLTGAEVEAKSAIDAATREMQQSIAKAQILTSPTAQISPDVDIPAELIITEQKYNLAYERLEENTKLFNEAEPNTVEPNMAELKVKNEKSAGISIVIIIILSIIMIPFIFLRGK